MMRVPTGKSLSNRSGKVTADDSVFPHSDTFGDGMRVRVTQLKDTSAAVNVADWKRQLALSRQLYGRLGLVSGSIRKKRDYAVGSAWVPQFKGSDKAWGRKAEEWLHNWFQCCNVRGHPYTFQVSLGLDSIALDRDGDSAMITVLDANGCPKLQWVSAHRIGDRGFWGQDYRDGLGVVSSGPYAGFRGYNGVIFGPSGAPIAYQILGRDPQEDQQVSAQSCQLIFDPDWHDQGRGISRLTYPILDWMDYQDIQHFLKRQVKQDSAMGILHYNEHGTADSTDGFIDGSDVGDTSIATEKIEGNEILYIKAQGGGRIEPYKSSRPDPNVQAFKLSILRSCHVGLDWPIELTDPSTIGGASTRLVQDIARHSIRTRQNTLLLRAMRAVMFGLSVAMEGTREIPRNTGDWWNWDFTLPAKLTVDSRYDDKTKMEKIKMGAGTYSDLYGDEGKWWEEEIDQRIEEQVYIETKCRERGVDPSRVQQLTPNGNSAPTQGAEMDSAEEDSAQTDKGDDATDTNDNEDPVSKARAR